MFNTFALVIMLVLSNGDSYTPQAQYHQGFTSCMDRAMLITNTYRKSDLKKYEVKCLKVEPETTSYD